MTINGVAYIPDGIEKAPTIIMSHGFNSNYTSNISYAETLAESGIAGYTFDFCGGSTGSTSDGSMLEMSVYGDRDSLVPLSYWEDAVEAYASAELIVLEGARHGFYGEDASKAINAVIGYIKQHLHTE